MSDRPDPLAPPAGYGEKRAYGPALPAGARDRPAGVPDHECDRRCKMLLGSESKRCRSRSIWHVTFGDPQEHIYETDLCTGHMVFMTRPGVCYCERCRKAGAPDGMTLIRKEELPWALDGPLEEPFSLNDDEADQLMDWIFKGDPG